MLEHSETNLVWKGQWEKYVYNKMHLFLRDYNNC